MYGDLGNFSNPTPQVAPGFFNGIKGDAVCFTKSFCKKLNFVWDERIQAADWHLYLTVAACHEKDPSVPLPRILLESYAHHFGRYSARQEFEPLTVDNPSMKIEDVWTPEEMKRLWWGNALPR
jgi:hypothetical protein